MIHYLSVKEGTPAEGYWDMSLLKDLTDGLPEGDREIFIIPGAYQDGYYEKINEELNKFEKVLVFITSDEEGNFRVDRLKHPDLKFFTQYGTSENCFPLGYTPFTREELRKIGRVKKDLRWFFAGQINHSRRFQMAGVLNNLVDGTFVPTDGFAKGMSHSEYYSYLARSVAVICPPGNLTQDSFRVYEALEAGCVPIVDRFSSQGNSNYWHRVFPDAPFLILNSYEQLPDLIEQAQDPKLRVKVFSWWLRKKQELRRQILDLVGVKEAVTAVVPTSYIQSHPSTEIIENTIDSIKFHTGSEILVTVDGLRPEHGKYRSDYEEYIERLLWISNFKYENIGVLVFGKHAHQSGMLRASLPMIKTPLILYVEHDTPLLKKSFDWVFLTETILTNKAHVIRFYPFKSIEPQHSYLMHFGFIKDPRLLATSQWSQRPHLARTAFYEELIKQFSPDSNCFIEDFVVNNSLVELDWINYKLFIYTPGGGNIQTSDHLDGRMGGKKYDDRQTY